MLGALNGRRKVATLQVPPLPVFCVGVEGSYPSSALFLPHPFFLLLVVSPFYPRPLQLKLYLVPGILFNVGALLTIRNQLIWSMLFCSITIALWGQECRGLIAQSSLEANGSMEIWFGAIRAWGSKAILANLQFRIQKG